MGTLHGRLPEVFVAAVVVAVLLGAVLGQPILVGFVETGSMRPTLAPGDGFVAIPEPVAGPPEPGDVVTYRAETLHGGGLTTHRVVGRTADGYVTRGDHNPFTDQQGGEPTVDRSQVVAVAWQVDGHVVVLPVLGAAVTTARDLLGAAASAVGLRADSRQVAVGLAVLFGSAYVLDELLAAGRTDRETGRDRSRDVGYDAGRVLAVGVLLVVGVATLSMVVPTGTATLTYDSVSADRAVSGGIPAGGERQVPLHLQNPAVVPSVVVLETPDGAPLSRDAVVLAPRERATVNVTVAAPATPGRYEQRIVQRRYLGVLPVGVLRALDAVHPWLAVATVDALVGAVVAVAGRLLLGRGRRRLRPVRRPAGRSARRWLGALYR